MTLTRIAVPCYEALESLPTLEAPRRKAVANYKCCDAHGGARCKSRRPAHYNTKTKYKK